MSDAIELETDWSAYDLTPEETIEGCRIFCAAMAEIGIRMEPTEDGGVSYVYLPGGDAYLRAVNLVQIFFGKPTYRDIDHLNAWCRWKGLM